MTVEETRESPRADLAVMGGLACVVLLVHAWCGNGYGFHRDELQFLDDARHLSFGFTAYPPMTALMGRIAIALFGISPQVFRLPAAIFNAASLVLLGLIARELGGQRLAQVITVLAGLPVALAFSTVLQYNTFDYFAWAALTLCLAKLLRTGDERWWIGAGAAIGFGVQSKYSIVFAVTSVLAGVLLLPSQRRHLRSRWFYIGILTGLLIAAPNLVWLVRHHFITLKMESFIHARDVRHGRADGYYTDQLKFTLLAFPLAVAGLISLVRNERFRLMSFLYLGPFALMAIARGRGYYLLPAYIGLYAAGAVALERFITPRGSALRVGVSVIVIVALFADTVVVSRMFLPIATVGSRLWTMQIESSGDIRDEIGWPEFVADVAHVRDSLQPQERDRLAVLAENYGEAGALALYGPSYGLPTPISGVNSFHDRGYGPFEAENVIVAGGSYDDLLKNFESCRVGSPVHIPYGVRNEEAVDHPYIYVCHHLRRPWAEVWAESQHFG